MNYFISLKFSRILSWTIFLFFLQLFFVIHPPFLGASEKEKSSSTIENTTVSHSNKIDTEDRPIKFLSNIPEIQITLRDLSVGAVGSIIATILIYIWQAVFKKKRFVGRYKEIWKDFIKNDLVVVIGTKNRPAQKIARQTGINESYAMSNISILYSKLSGGRSIKLSSSDDIESEYSKNNKILIGGPNNNEKIKNEMNNIKNIFFSKIQIKETENEITGEKIPLYGLLLNVGNYCFKSGYSDVLYDDMQKDETGKEIKKPIGLNVTRDWGLVIKLCEDGCVKLILCGRHGYGTHAAALATTDRVVLKEINRLLKFKKKTLGKEYIAIVESSIEENRVQQPKVIDVIKLEK